jgi:hypothetical protein
MVYFPWTTTISGTNLGVSCLNFGAYHNENDLGLTPFAYAVMPTCDHYSPYPYYTQISASHELAEASSDPFVQTAPAYTSSSFNNGWIGEIGDVCTPFDTFYRVNGGTYYAVQRIWSNAAAAAGTQPCIPAPGTLYAALTPDGGTALPSFCDPSVPEACTSVFVVSAGQTYDLTLTGWINQPSVAAAVIAVGSSITGGRNQFNPQIALDRYNFRNGDEAHLTVQIPAGTPSQQGGEITILSGFDNDNYAYWPIALYVQ